jgi:Xaa-Pro aminopeptidase
VASVRDAGQWKLALSAFLSYAEGVCIDGNEHEFRRWSRNTPAHQLAQWIRDEYPGYPLHRAAPIFRRIRMRKEAEELLQIRVACSITGKAFERVARFARPGVWEFELEAEIVHEFIRNRATGPAFPPIVASGKNSCTLHYIRNESQCQPGDIIQLDLGAEYGHYNGDLSRVIPVSGTFDARQREVYEAVLRVLRGSIAHIRPGITLQELHLNTAQMMPEELLRLGLLDAEQVKKEKDQPVSYRKYFMHPVSHHLGLDTHDLADRFAPLAPGMVLTVEPGIYIPEEGMGMRLENDVLVTEDGVEDLTAGIPLEVEEIEELMN